MSSYKRDSANGIDFPTSFRAQPQGPSDPNDMDENFRTGDFSSKHFTRKSSVFSINQETSYAESPKTRRIEGGFHEKPPQPNIDNRESQSYKSTRAIFNVNTINSVSNLSSSLKRDPVHQPKPQRSFVSTNTASASTNVLPDPIPNSIANPLSRALTPKRADSPNPSQYSVAVGHEVDVSNPDRATIETVARHLVQDSDSINTNHQDEEFNSLQLQGGDISRELYNWQRGHANNQSRRRSMSFSGSLGGSSITEPAFQVHDIRVPGGFRRSFLVQKASRQQMLNNGELPQQPTFFTKNFIEFLTLYGHFAGEELRDEDDDDEEGIFDEDMYEDVIADEESSLLNQIPDQIRPTLRRKATDHQHKATTTKAVLLLLKAFIGTGVLFLPKGFQNAGWGFSLVALSLFSVLSYFCFMLLINARIKMGASSYGDLGGELYGPGMRLSILTSIVLSQIGFAAAYIVFTATNLQAFISSVASWDLSIEFYILAQLVIFIPFSLTRRIQKLSGTALVADLFILLGLVYVYYYCSFEILHKGVAKSIRVFNNDWSVFIGTAIFTYEGIGLLIPIQESMKKPSKFPMLLFWVMFVSTIVFISAGSVGYLAFGAETETVILLNFPQDNILVSISQFLYSMAILLSTPLQLFPAIRILENGLFVKSGKKDPKVKWTKNSFRVVLVVLTSLLAWGGASNLDRFVAIIGSFACIPLIYLYPPLLHLKSLNKDATWSRMVDIIVVIFGFGLMVYTTYQTLSDWF